MTDIAHLTKLIEPEAQALGLSLVRVQMNGGKSDPTLQVMAERPDTRQLDLTDCEALSRRLSDLFDTVDPIEEAYRLEVSSPGIDRPLTRLADFADWAGFAARIKLVERLDGRKQFDAVLQGLDGETILLDGGKGGQFAIPYTNIQSAKLVLTDKLIKATAPLSVEGADRISTEG
ncbi:ribosome maturation protein RimP [Sphingomonas naphthae]|uniref:Ribosome maturation factor RimP n=1 Tax=Sphingomonas naphthae TaxID=1813468 RepID=A0ABY7TM80_9SPHN|nr:ribosome maturation protein RimP [Sphingomonas naphthae]WCT74055.1 ribosome maturation protein RimP [Sphingomonas naphthae]